MLGKLLKYDLKFCYKNLIVFYILTIFFSTFARIIGNLKDTLIITIMNNIIFSILIIMVINIIINYLLRNWISFRKDIYKDESYLIHTLPLSKNKIYLSKILTSVITLITSFIVIITGLSIAYLDENTWEIFKKILEQSSVIVNSSIFEFTVIMLFTIFFELLFVYMSGLLGIIIGHRFNNLKIIKSIIIGFLIYMIMSSLSLGIFYVAGLIDHNFINIFNSKNVSSNYLRKFMIIGTAIYAIYNLMIYFIGNKIFNKGVNVD